MARKGRGSRKKAKVAISAPPVQVSPLEKARRLRVGMIDAAFAKRHPHIAKQQRTLRVQHAERQANWSHKRHGTPETLDRAARTRQGALARLYEAGKITADDLAGSQEIRAVAERIESGVALRTASLEARVDGSRGGDRLGETLRRVRHEMAYTRWRTMIPLPRRMVMDMVVLDIGYSAAGLSHGVHYRKALGALISALRLWPECLAWARTQVDQHDVDHANRAAGLQ